MKLLVTGGSGVIGSALCARATELGWTSTRLRRTTNGSPSGPTWDVTTGRIDLSQAGPLDAVIHLAGETIAQRWTSAARRRIRESRVVGTRALGAALKTLPTRPRVIICASATGYYGDRGDEWVDEGSAPGRGFLSEVCQDWEATARQEMPGDSRLVLLRFGIVLTNRGGALTKMLPVFRLGLGGKLGDGRQYWSWIALHDLVRVIERALMDDRWCGVCNVVSPNPVTNAQFTRSLGTVLNRPTGLGIPRFLVGWMLGAMGREALLFSTRVRPARLLELGYDFDSPTLAPALEGLLKRG
ncbi:MAG TPA: TIGR01777 family oxidoreductase [Verrucomicrobiae bacterium]|nr:TIGR01777 family oxidoreductase [Verrucomicrobiae bacterium]